MKRFSWICMRMYVIDHRRLQRLKKMYADDPTKDIQVSDIVSDIDFHEQVMLDYIPQAWVENVLLDTLSRCSIRPHGYVTD